MAEYADHPLALWVLFFVGLAALITAWIDWNRPTREEYVKKLQEELKAKDQSLAEANTRIASLEQKVEVLERQPERAEAIRPVPHANLDPKARRRMASTVARPPFSNLKGTIVIGHSVGVQYVVDSDKDSVSDLAWHVVEVHIYRPHLSQPGYRRIDKGERFVQDWPEGRTVLVGAERSEIVLVRYGNGGFARLGAISATNPLYKDKGTYIVKMQLKADGKIVPWLLHFDFDPSTGFADPTVPMPGN